MFFLFFQNRFFEAKKRYFCKAIFRFLHKKTSGSEHFEPLENINYCLHYKMSGRTVGNSHTRSKNKSKNAPQ